MRTKNYKKTNMTRAKSHSNVVQARIGLLKRGRTPSVVNIKPIKKVK